MEKLNIYFDNAATTAHLPSGESISFGNPSSPHGVGIRAERELDESRENFAGILKCTADEIIFTSGGTESNNLAITGFSLANKRNDVVFSSEGWEHPSVLEPIRIAEENGFARAQIAPLNEILQVTAEKHLISISHVCHETGDINDISTIAKELKKHNPSAVIHVDGAQGFCKESIDFRGIDMYTFSGHKFHGPSGVGGLMVRSYIKLLPFMFGGGQEKGLRPGTQNVPGIAEMARVAKNMCQSIDSNHAHVTAIKNTLSSLQDDLPDVHINTRGGNVSPYILSISFMGIKGETLVHLLSDKGIFVSMGAACRSRKKEKSLLEVMGFSRGRAQSAVRFSFSPLNTLDEAVIAKKIIIDCVGQLRRIFGFK